NQSPAYQAPVPQTHSVTKNDFDNYVKAQSMQIETNKLNNQMANLTDMLAKFVTAIPEDGGMLEKKVINGISELTQ
ncbi:hypothetical protein Tco_0172226, partial [Tanacetum coccineum]